MKKCFKIYFAGGLFSHKDLIGNVLLANSIEEESEGKFQCILPQNFEQRKNFPKEIRDEDISAVLHSDMAIFNFDGSELDSGTVVEFMFAKFADIPSLIIRSDFRGGGDCIGISTEQSFPWNLMASFYPRTDTLLMNSANMYKDAKFDINAMIWEMTKLVIPKLDKLSDSQPTMPKNVQSQVFEWLAKMPNFDSDRAAEIMSILERKRKSNLL